MYTRVLAVDDDIQITKESNVFDLLTIQACISTSTESGVEHSVYVVLLLLTSRFNVFTVIVMHCTALQSRHTPNIISTLNADDRWIEMIVRS